MAASIIRHAARKRILVKGIFKLNVQLTGTRCLFSKEKLGLDRLLEERKKAKNTIGDMRANILKQAKDIVENPDKGVLIASDVESLVNIVETDYEVNLLHKVIKRYFAEEALYKNPLNVYFSGSKFMKLLHVLNKWEIAYDFAMNEEMVVVGQFNNVANKITAMDLLFKNGSYQNVIDVGTKFISEITAASGPQMSPFQQYRRMVTDMGYLYLGALSKLNTPESLELTLSFLKDYMKEDLYYYGLPVRFVEFASILALKQNQPATAVEILSSKQESTFTELLNFKILACIRLKRHYDILLLLKSLYMQDVPVAGPSSQKLFPDVIVGAEELFDKCEDYKAKEQFKTLKRILSTGNHTHNLTIESFINRPVEKKVTEDSKKYDIKKSFYGDKSRYDRFRGTNNRYSKHTFVEMVRGTNPEIYGNKQSKTPFIVEDNDFRLDSQFDSRDEDLSVEDDGPKPFVTRTQ